MSWKSEVGGWAVNSRDTNPSRKGTRGSALEDALSSVTARASPPLHGSRPKSPLLNKSSPSRTPATEAVSRASPSSLAQKPKATTQQQPNAFIPKGWMTQGQPKAMAKLSKVVFADRIDDRSQIDNAANLSLPSLHARSQAIGSGNSSIDSGDQGKSKWVTLYGGSNGEFQHVLHHLTVRCGPIRRVHWPATTDQCNWMHVQFMDTVGAAAAVDSPLSISMPAIGGGGQVTVRFAVSWCTDSALVSYYHAQDLEEEEAQLLLSGHLCEEDEAPMDTVDDGKHPGLASSAPEVNPSRGDEGEEAHRPIGALARIAKLSDSSKRFALSDPSTAILHSSSAANRNFHNSFSSQANGGHRGVNSTRSLYRSAHISSKAEARNANVFVPFPSQKGLRTAADLWHPSDIPIVPATVDALIAVAVSPFEWAARWWWSEDIPIANSATASSNIRFEDDAPSFFSFLWGESYDDPPVPMTTRKSRAFSLHRPIVSTVHEPLTNDVWTVVRPIPWYLDYGRLVSVLLLVLVGALVYYVIGGPILWAFTEAISNLISFITGTIGLAFGSPNEDPRAAVGGGGGAAPRWEYLYESNFANENKRNDYYAF